MKANIPISNWKDEYDYIKGDILIIETMIIPTY